MASKGGASTDLFSGSGFGSNGLMGQGGKLSAGTFNAAGGAVSDFYAAEGYETKAEGYRLEGQNYDLAASLAESNIREATAGTAIKVAQQQRATTLGLGAQQSDIAGAGFSNSGTSLDLMRDSAAQGALAENVAQYQGDIQVEGYQEQAQSLRLQSQAADVAAHGASIAGQGAMIGGALKGIAAIASIL